MKILYSKLVPFSSQVFTDAFMFKDSVQNGASISTPISCCYAIMSTPHLSASMVAKFESYVSKPIFLSPSTKFHEVSCYINHWISSYVQKFMLAITQMVKIHQNCQFHEHSLGLTKFHLIYHFCCWTSIILPCKSIF